MRGRAPRWREGAVAASFSYAEGLNRAIIALWRTPAGDWSAAHWYWRPSEKAATRAWQARQWARIEAGAAPPEQRLSDSAAPLMATWLALTSDSPSAIDKGQWIWQLGDACLRMRTADISQAQLTLPYSRDDTRLEQRAAMQVQLARKIPGATWVRPFTLISASPDGARSGAKFMAVWIDAQYLHGQVWIPQKDSSDIARARISTALPAGTRADPARSGALARLVEEQLVRFAHLWEKTYE
jgi:hypothetical protein